MHTQKFPQNAPIFLSLITNNSLPISSSSSSSNQNQNHFIIKSSQSPTNIYPQQLKQLLSLFNSFSQLIARST
ncbi:hypothetical protein QVD17_03815 [Tagetes erecta]|uniref:Uncharacterized protein n=1 Tax=Tagetes erecta TaxID=13708 RepID=A0AAD8L900_TARER|nr:hypothetical protein QVD17_03815 [Tagetes erecta]